MNLVRIGSQEFSAAEWKAVIKAAKEKPEYSPNLTKQNVIRLLLGLSIKKRGGARPNTGNRVRASALHPSGDAETGRRAGEKHKKP